MSNERSREALLDFLEYLANKGLIAKNTANGRRVTANRVLGILSDEEARDVTVLDLDEVMTRFQNLEGKSYTPGSLATYRARLNTALEDFDAYLKNPLAFKPNVRSRGSRERPKKESPKTGRSKLPQEPKHGSSSQSTAVPPMSNSIVPIAIRHDVTVHIQGLPFDLSEAEAERIANVVRAMATPV